MSFSICSRPAGCRSRRGHTERLHQRPGVVLGARRWWRSPAWCRPGCWCAAGPAGPSPCRPSSAWVESRPPETPITTFLMPVARRRFISPAPGCCRPRSSARRDARVGRHVREALDRPPQRRALLAAPRSNSTRRKRAARSRCVARSTPEAGRAACGPAPAARGRCRRRSSCVLAEALGLGQQVAVLVDQRLAVPRQVGGRLAGAGGE